MRMQIGFDTARSASGATVMDDKNTVTNAIQDTNPVTKINDQRKHRHHPASMVVAGTLIAGLAVGVGVQLLRAQPESVKPAVVSQVSTSGEL